MLWLITAFLKWSPWRGEPERNRVLVTCNLSKGLVVSPDFSPRLGAFGGLQEGRGFSPAEIAAPPFCSSRAPRSWRLQAARGAGIIKKVLQRRG
jgi:hypothetical protein